MTLIESMQSYLDGFLVELERDEWVRIDWLEYEAVSFSISPLPLDNNGIIRSDVVGNVEKSYQVMFSVVFDYTPDLQQQIENSSFFEDLDKWLKKNNKERIFPKLEEGKKPISIGINQTPYLFYVPEDNQVARYTTTIDLRYKERI